MLTRQVGRQWERRVAWISAPRKVLGDAGRETRPRNPTARPDRAARPRGPTAQTPAVLAELAVPGRCVTPAVCMIGLGLLNGGRRGVVPLGQNAGVMQRCAGGRLLRESPVWDFWMALVWQLRMASASCPVPASLRCRRGEAPV